MPLERRLLERALSGKGFTLDDKRDHRYYWLFVGGKYTGIYTKVSTGKGYRTIDDSLVSKIARQLKISRQDLLDLVECSLTAAGYLDKLRESGISLE